MKFNRGKDTGSRRFWGFRLMGSLPICAELRRPLGKSGRLSPARLQTTGRRRGWILELKEFTKILGILNFLARMRSLRLKRPSVN